MNGEPICNCIAGSPSHPFNEHIVTCPVYEPPLTYSELRQVRELLMLSRASD